MWYVLAILNFGVAIALIFQAVRMMRWLHQFDDKTEGSHGHKFEFGVWGWMMLGGIWIAGLIILGVYSLVEALT